MSWWPLWGAQRGRGTETGPGELIPSLGLASGLGALDTALRPEVPAQRLPDSSVRPVTLRRVRDGLDRLEIRYLTDGDGSLLAMWERHAVLFALEGPSDEILVMRGRPHGTVPPEWADRAYRAVNEWNYTRRFLKAYIGDATERGQLPIYAEVQVPLAAGAHDALLDELLDCAAAVTAAFVEWLHDEGALL
jgi:putative sensory transduction regulator